MADAVSVTPEKQMRFKAAQAGIEHSIRLFATRLSGRIRRRGSHSHTNDNSDNLITGKARPKHKLNVSR